MTKGFATHRLRTPALEAGVHLYGEPVQPTEAFWTILSRSAFSVTLADGNFPPFLGGDPWLWQSVSCYHAQRQL